ncbi:MAG: diaminopimelate epimerase [Lachnospiraceae bacterium]|nr:diaminopimelate epimerase [Lachnospiraceae bacterium]
MKFTKMQGCGNDYVYVNCFTEKIENAPELAKRVSNRNFGIGSDGLILVCPSAVADVRMVMYNADGSQSQMCGNGIRCVGKFAYDYGLVNKECITVETLAGIKTLQLQTENGKVKTVTVDMGKPELEAKKIPVLSEKEQVIGEPVRVLGTEYTITCVSMGNPHAVTFVESVSAIEIEKVGPVFEHHPMFPERVNTEFIELAGKDELKMRVWERGSGETLACGTGACASAYAAMLNGYTGQEVLVHLLGGDLQIRLDEETGHIFMTGPAVTVYEGEWL